MFTFIKQYAERIDGVTIYAFISLFIFFAFFVVLLVVVKRMGKERIDELSRIPLDQDELNQSIS